MTDVALAEVPVTRTDGYRATRELISRDPRPTAILALSDVLAYGAVDALHELGLDVPGDVSVTGFDDLAGSAWFRPRLTTVRQPIVAKGRTAADFLPRLTTVRQPIVAKGRTAADFLISTVRGEDQHPHQVLGTTLIVRDSAVKPRA